jgi:F-type H+-transporting ATPase subunit gamma
MGSLKEIRTRISSVTSTRQITSAMKMVSAAKLKRAQDNITKLRPYSEKLEQILGNISAGLSESDNNAYTQKRELKKVLLIAISSNRGLCGAFNTNITKKVIELKETKYKGIAVDMVEIGKKAGDALRYRGYSSVASYNDIYDDLTFDAVSEIASTYMNAFVAGEYDAIELVYNQFKNAATQIIQAEPFLPVVVESKEDLVEMNYIFEPNQENIVNDLIPKALKLQLFKSVLDSNASEHGARMTAMHKATDNASDLISDLQLTYNKARQASITNEILEIVGGAEALKG